MMVMMMMSRPRSRSVSSPEKKKKSGGGVKKKLHPPPDTPLSATPTCIPPTAPPPVFPSSSPPRGPAPAPACDPAHAPLTATPLHKDWVSETADFVAVMAFNLPHLTRAVRGAPDCSPDDGVLWLLVIRANVSRVSLLQLLAGMDSGRRLSVPGVDMFPVTAIKISVSSRAQIRTGLFYQIATVCSSKTLFAIIWTIQSTKYCLISILLNNNSHHRTISSSYCGEPNEAARCTAHLHM